MKIKRIARIIIWGFCCFLFATLLFFQTPPFQKAIQYLLIDQLQKKTGFDIEIEKINGLLPFWCHCEGVKISSSLTSDNNKTCHAEIGTFDLVVNPFSLFYKTIAIQHLSISNSRCFSIPKFPSAQIGTTHSNNLSVKKKFDLHVHHFRLDNIHLGKEILGENFEEEKIFKISLAGLFSYEKTDKLFAKVQLSLPSQNEALHAIVENDPATRELSLSTRLKIPARCPELQHFLGKQNINFDLPPMDLRISGKAPLDFWSSLFNSQKRDPLPLSNFNGEVHGIIEAPPPPCQEWFLWQFGKKWELHSGLTITRRGEIILPSLNLKTSYLNTKGQLGWAPKGVFLESYLSGEITQIELLIPDHLKEEILVDGQLFFSGPINGSFSRPELNFEYQTQDLKIIYLNQELPDYIKENLQPQQIEGSLALIIEDESVNGFFSASTILFNTPAQFDSTILWQKGNFVSLENIHLSLLESNIQGLFFYLFNAENPYRANLLFYASDLKYWEPFINNFTSSNLSLEGRLNGHYVQDDNETTLKLNPELTKIDNILLADGEIQLNYVPNNPPLWNVDASIQRGAFGEIGFNSLNLKTQISNTANIPYQLEILGGDDNTYTIFSLGKYTQNENLFSIDIESFSGQWYSYPFSLKEPTELTFKEHSTTISSFTIDVGSSQEAELVGSFQRVEEEFTLKLKMDHFPLEMINPFSQRLPMSGEISSEVFLTQRDGEVSGNFNLKMDQIDLLDIAYDTIPYLNFYLSGDFHQHSLEFEGELSGFSDESFKMKSEIPFVVSFDPFEISLKKDQPFYLDVSGQAPLTPLTSFLIDETIIVQAVVDVNSTFSGTLNQPELSGTLNVSNATIESIKTGALAKNVELEIVGSGSQFIINKFHGDDPNGGSLDATGYIQIDFHQGLSYDIDIISQNFRLVELDPVTADVNTQLNFNGSQEGANLTGTITVTKSSVIIPKEPPVSVPFVEVTYRNILCEHIQELISASSPLNLFLNIDVAIPSNLTMEGRGLNSEWMGSIHIYGKAPDLVYTGTLDVISGEFVFSKRKFELTSGQIQVNGLKTRDIFINLNAELQLSQFLITVNLKGPLSEPQVTFTSNPSLCTSEILSWILFDSDLSEISAFQALQITQALVVLSGHYAGPDFLGKIKEALGLDVLDISSADIDTADVTFQVGKYISKGIFVGVNKSVSGDKDAISIQAKVTRRLSLQADLGGDAGGKLIFKWYRSY